MERLYNQKLIMSGDRVEIYDYGCYLTEGKKSTNDDGRKGKTGLGATEESKQINRKTTLNRARNKIIRLIKSNPGLTTFITLTYKDNFQDLSKSKEHLKVLFKKLGKSFPGFKYIYVLEYQSRGAIHYHMLCNYPVLRELSQSNKVKTDYHKDLEKAFARQFWSNRGFVDIRSFKEVDNMNVALYVAAYLVEDLIGLDLKGNKCFGYSRKLNKPIEVKIDNKDSIDSIISKFDDYKVTYLGNYNISYYDTNGSYRNSKVTYIDLDKERGIKNEN